MILMILRIRATVTMTLKALIHFTELTWEVSLVQLASVVTGIGGDGAAIEVHLMAVRAWCQMVMSLIKISRLAVRYAVDNGAAVINMSFGKAYSPHAERGLRWHSSMLILKVFY